MIVSLRAVKFRKILRLLKEVKVVSHPNLQGSLSKNLAKASKSVSGPNASPDGMTSGPISKPQVTREYSSASAESAPAELRECQPPLDEQSLCD